MIAENEDVKEVCDFGLIQKVLEASMKSLF